MRSTLESLLTLRERESECHTVQRQFTYAAMQWPSPYHSAVGSPSVLSPIPRKRTFCEYSDMDVERTSIPKRKMSSPTLTEEEYEMRIKQRRRYDSTEIRRVSNSGPSVGRSSKTEWIEIGKNGRPLRTLKRMSKKSGRDFQEEITDLEDVRAGEPKPRVRKRSIVC